MLSVSTRPIVSAILLCGLMSKANAQVPDALKWAELLKAAKGEGEVSVAGPPEAQDIYESNMLELSLRADTNGASVPEYVRPRAASPRPIDDYDLGYWSGPRATALEDVKKILPR